MLSNNKTKKYREIIFVSISQKKTTKITLDFDSRTNLRKGKKNSNPTEYWSCTGAYKVKKVKLVGLSVCKVSLSYIQSLYKQTQEIYVNIIFSKNYNKENLFHNLEF